LNSCCVVVGISPDCPDIGKLSDAVPEVTKHAYLETSTNTSFKEFKKCPRFHLVSVNPPF